MSASLDADAVDAAVVDAPERVDAAVADAERNHRSLKLPPHPHP